MPRNQYILDRPTGPALRARDAIAFVVIAGLILLVFKGQSIRTTGERMPAGVERSVLLAVGHPAGWIADRIGLDDDVGRLTASLSPDEALTGAGGFAATAAASGAGARDGAIALLTPEAFDPAALGEKPAVLPRLGTLLVTGDSMSQPLDAELARRLAPKGVKTIRDSHIGTGISLTEPVDWGSLSARQVREHEPDAVVVIIGANDGFDFPAASGGTIACCGAAWAAQYGNRVRRMMQTYGRDGAARVYWLLMPAPRAAPRARVIRTVNAAVSAAAQAYLAHVRVVDLHAVFTPGGAFRAAMPIAGRNTIVRRPDGLHLNEAGGALAADVIAARLRADFASP